MEQTTGANWWRIPLEMQQLPQWTLAGPDKAPYCLGAKGLYHASPTKGPWHTFEDACKYAHQNKCGIGFIITDSDPYTCIDMDVKDIRSRDKDDQPLQKEQLTPIEALKFYAGTVDFANSYTEFSASGKGLHTWVLGDIGAGRRGKGFEVYSRERFIICTGNPVSELKYHIIDGIVFPQPIHRNQLPIADGTAILGSLVSELGPIHAVIDLVEVEQELTDSQIYERATGANNSHKFVQLCEGHWQQYGFPSQSEADLALMSMFTFYSTSNEQCRRLFRETMLGSRDKAIKDDVYLDRTLKVIRSRQEKANGEIERARISAEAMIRNTKEKALKNEKPNPNLNPIVKQYIKTLDQKRLTADQPSTELQYHPPEVEGLEWPPGLVGAIAGFIYQSAPRPVKEVAIVAALGLMAGISGKAYNIGQTGFNLYIILIAQSAIGKEAMHSGIGHILNSPCGHAVSRFVDYTDYVSGPALTKAVSNFSSFVNVSGEWGKKLSRMADDKKEGAMQQLRTVMTHLYQKSGSSSVVGGLGYSDDKRDVSSVKGVAYSMIGETTPDTFYDSLTQSMMGDGFLSRFNIIEYEGERPPQNKTPMMDVPSDISNALSAIATHCAQIVGHPGIAATQVKMEPEAEKLIEDFNLYCDTKIREAGKDESIRQIWNRAHLKVIRVAGVLAVSDNYQTPVVSTVHAKWALHLIEKDAGSMLNKILSGDIGADDHARFKKLMMLCQSYVTGKISQGYRYNKKMIKNSVITRQYLQTRTSQLRCFTDYRMGATMGMDHSVKSAVESGYLREVAKDTAIKEYNFHGRCFEIIDLP